MEKKKSTSDPKEQKPSKPTTPSLTMEQVVMALVSELDPDKQRLVQRAYLKARLEVAMKAVGVMGMAFVGALIVIAYLALNASQNKEFYNISQDAKVQKARTVQEESVTFSRNQVSGWLNEALVESLDFNFRNVDRSTSSAAEKYFTEEGAKEYGTAITSIRRQVLDSNGILSIEFEGKTKYIGDKRTANGRVWRLSKPVRLIMDRPNNKPLQLRANATVTIVRVDDWENEKGLAISRIQIIETSESAQ